MRAIGIESFRQYWLSWHIWIKFIFLSLLSLVLVLLLLFFNGATLSFNIPSGDNANLIWNIRIQFVVKTLLSAGAIGLSNYLIQMFTRNKLADTSIFGINSFQQIVVACFILLAPAFFLKHEQSYLFGLIYLVTSVVSGFIFYLISLHTALNSRRILIYGILLNVLITAFAYFILTSDVINPDVVQSRFIDYQRKVFGGLSLDNDYSGMYLNACLFVMCLIWTFVIKLKIMANSGNPFKQHTLGITANAVKLNVILLISILGGIIFSIVGFVSFIGVSISFITSSLFKTFNQNIFGSILISVVLMLVSQFIHISLSSVASGISLTTVVGIICFPIFLIFMLIKR